MAIWSFCFTCPGVDIPMMIFNVVSLTSRNDEIPKNQNLNLLSCRTCRSESLFFGKKTKEALLYWSHLGTQKVTSSRCSSPETKIQGSYCTNIWCKIYVRMFLYVLSDFAHNPSYFRFHTPTIVQKRKHADFCSHSLFHFFIKKLLTAYRAYFRATIEKWYHGHPFLYANKTY